MALKYVQALTQYLAGSGCLIGSTNVVLTSFTDIYGNAITSITPFGTKGYITFEPDTTNEEAATFTSVTVNANGTVTLGGVSTALAQSPYTETAGTQRSHSGGTKVVITDNVAFWNTFGNKNNDESLTGRWSTGVAPVNGADLVNKTYADSLAIAGAPNASTVTKGIVQAPTQAQTDAKTATGSTGAVLAVTPDTLRSTLINDYKVDTGAANAYVITPAPAITAYATGQIFTFKAVNANTGASTVNVNGIGAKNIFYKTAALTGGEIMAGQIVEIEYDGTQFQMNSASSNPNNVTQTYTPGAGGTATLDLTKGNVHYITMPAGNITIAITGGVAGQFFQIRILQDAGGSRTVTWFTTIKWATGTVPTLTTTASKADTFVMQVTTAGSAYDGYIAGQSI